MPTYDGIGSSVTHEIEVVGDVFISNVEGGSLSTQVPFEIFSNVSGMATPPTDSRQVRLRVQPSAVASPDDSYVTDMGIQNTTDNYFFITAPQNTSTVGVQNTFVISTTSNVGIGTTDPVATLQVVGNAWITGTLTASNIVGASPVTISSDIVMASGFTLTAAAIEPPSGVESNMNITGTLTTSNIFHETELTVTSNLLMGSDKTLTTSNIFHETELTVTSNLLMGSDKTLTTSNIETSNLTVSNRLSGGTISVSNIEATANLVVGGPVDITGTLSSAGITSSADVNVTGTISASGSLEAAKDDNITSFLGRAAVGYNGTNDWATFAHIDHNNTTGYAVGQSNNGDTVLNRPTGTNLTLRENDVAQVMLLSGGKVGIGTNNPTHGRVQILCSSQSQDGGLTIRGGDFYGGLGAMWVEGSGSGQKFNIQAYKNENTDPPSGVNPSTLDSDAYSLCLNPKGGNVGIGVDNPTCTLQIKADDNSSKVGLYAKRVWVSGIGDNSDDTVGDNTGSPWYGLGFDNLAYNGVTYTSDIPILSGYSGVALRSAFGNIILKQNGNVGIGITEPTEKLHVAGHGTFTGNVNAGSIINNGTFAAANGFMSGRVAVFGDTTLNYGGGTNWQTNGRTAGLLLECLDTTEFAVHDVQTRLASMMYYSGNKITIGRDMGWGGISSLNLCPSGGNVGIGVADPTCKIDFGSNLANRIISLWRGSTGSSSSTDFYGFGVTGGTLRYNVATSDDVHRFYGGTIQFGYVNTGDGFVNSFTGQHKSFPHYSLLVKNIKDIIGLIVSASGEHISINDDIPKKGQDAIQISESIPTVKLSTKEKDKAVFGVVSDVEDKDAERKDHNGSFVSVFEKESGDNRIYVNSLGEGAVWVVNTNGILQNGDYITTSNVAGYGQKQDSEFLANYTVAKITMDCDFNPPQQPVQIILKDEEGNNILDQYGQLQWVDDPSGAMEAAYKVKELDGGILAAFVGCTYHCG